MPKKYLQEHFGKDYASKSAEIAKSWDSIQENFPFYYHGRDRTSVQCWLSSTGHLVGNHVTDEMRDAAYDAIAELIQNLDITKNDIQCKVLNTGKEDANFFVTTELSCGNHRVKRRFKMELLPYFRETTAEEQ